MADDGAVVFLVAFIAFMVFGMYLPGGGAPAFLDVIMVRAMMQEVRKETFDISRFSMFTMGFGVRVCVCVCVCARIRSAYSVGRLDMSKGN